MILICSFIFLSLMAVVVEIILLAFLYQTTMTGDRGLDLAEFSAELDLRLQPLRSSAFRHEVILFRLLHVIKDGQWVARS